MAKEWQPGDVYALPMTSDLAKERGLLGHYLLLQMIDKMVWYPKKTVPILYAKITENECLPTDEETYDAIPFIQTKFTKWEERFWPLDGRRLQEDIREKQSKAYIQDEYGFLPHYRFVYVRPVSKAVPKGALFIGNFSNARKPGNEFIPHDKINLTVNPMYKPLEIWLIERYFYHNKRELSIYRKNTGDGSMC